MVNKVITEKAIGLSNHKEFVNERDAVGISKQMKFNNRAGSILGGGGDF
ncbi:MULTISPECIES: hypothetical protein [Virgibacillus]|uniref:Uncharacterized protein n=1 Tax=Virgibacillus dokdonensis TaxID=302167 RepID=A0ABU7VE70_9BACI|nr:MULTISPECIES: hypothetical protein [Virgibacillus]NWO12541.1 hypothetical protein [Virgibacillus sp.]